MSSEGKTGYITNGMMLKRPLTLQEETEYAIRYKNGDAEAGNVLVERNLRLVAHIAKRYAVGSDVQEDLLSIGTIGLIKAVNSFDVDRGIKLGTYAVRCIENEILMYLRSDKKHCNDISLCEPVGIDHEGNEIAVEDVISDDGEELIDRLDKEMGAERLRRKVEEILNERERKIIKLRYGLLNGYEKTQREVGKLLGISRSYVSRIEKAALRKLRNSLQG